MTLLKQRPNPHPLVPRFDELSLFLTSVSFLLTFLINANLRVIAYNFMVTDFDWKMAPVYVVVVLFLSGMIASLYHVFTTARKTESQKTAMLYFAVLANGLAGFMAGAQMLETSRGLLTVFPLWNIINALLLFFMYWGNVVDENTISDSNASPLQTIIGTIAVGCVFVACHFGFHLYWALTLSICVSYATNVSTITDRFLPKRVQMDGRGEPAN